MANVNITPQTVLLTSGQAVPFEATGAGGQPVSVNWSLNPPTPASGSLVILRSPVAQALSATYVAPPLVAAAQTVAVIASTTTDSATATISLTPDAVAIVPAKVDLKAGEEQKFVAIVAGAPTPGARLDSKSPPWEPGRPDGIVQGPSGDPGLDDGRGRRHTPCAWEAGCRNLNLTLPPWQGLGVSILGIYLLLVFSLVFLMVGLWPPELPSADAAKTNRIEAEKTLGEKADDLKSAELAAAKALEEKKTAMETSNKNVQSAGTPENKTQGNAANLGAANANATAADAALQRAKEAWDFASKDLNKKRTIEEAVDDPNVDTKLAGHINRELDLLWLVLLAGSLGSFLHIAQSYSDFIGNRTLKSSWAWWYSFRPFIGAGLALVFYAAVRGGVMAVATGSNATAKAAELNPFGLVSVAAMVGMFSKAATTKLGEVFDTLFKSGKAKE